MIKQAQGLILAIERNKDVGIVHGIYTDVIAWAKIVSQLEQLKKAVSDDLKKHD